MKKTLSALVLGTLLIGAFSAEAYDQWQGYCANRTNAYDNAELTVKPGVQYVGAGDHVTVLDEWGNAYLVRYPLINGKTKDRWVPKSAISGKPSSSGSAFVAGVQKAVQATVQAVSFQEWEGICANRTNAYDNAELTVKPGVQYVGAGDKVTVLQESGNAYLVRYPLINGKTKDRWVPKSAITRIGGSSRSDNAPTMPANTIVCSAPTRQETTVSFQEWEGICANRTNAYDNAELTVKPGVQYVGAGDKVTVLQESGNAYLVRYPLINGKTKEKWVPKSAISKSGGNSATNSTPVSNGSTENSIISRMNSLSEGTYRKNTKFNGSGECRGFANDIYTRLFPGVNRLSGYSYDNLGATSYAGSYILGSKKLGTKPNNCQSVTDSYVNDLKSMFSQAKPGCFIQMARKNSWNSARDAGKPHSAILYSISDGGCQFYEANVGSYNLIEINYYSWWDLANKNIGLTIYAPNNYALK